MRNLLGIRNRGVRGVWATVGRLGALVKAAANRSTIKQWGDPLAGDYGAKNTTKRCPVEYTIRWGREATELRGAGLARGHMLPTGGKLRDRTD
jgi:hypothetical protein